VKGQSTPFVQLERSRGVVRETFESIVESAVNPETD